MNGQLIAALETIRLHAQAMSDDASASHRGAWHTVASIADKALAHAQPEPLQCRHCNHNLPEGVTPAGEPDCPSCGRDN